MGNYTISATFLYLNLKILRKRECIHTRLARSHSSACGPGANLKSTNTHGSERRESTEDKQSGGRPLLCLGPVSARSVLEGAEQTPVRNTTLSAECLFNRADVKKDQMVLMDNTGLRDTLQCVSLLHARRRLLAPTCFPGLFSSNPPPSPLPPAPLIPHPPSPHCVHLSSALHPNFQMILLDLPPGPAHPIFFLVEHTLFPCFCQCHLHTHTTRGSGLVKSLA